MSFAVDSDPVSMLISALACCLIGTFGTMLVRERAEAERRRTDQERTRELAVELALHVAEKTPIEGEIRVPRRMVERILLLAPRCGADPGDARSAALAAALPPGSRSDNRLALPEGTRSALAYRHARWDGQGVVTDLSGAKIPVPAQLLAAVDWLEARDGASREALIQALHFESGRTLSVQIATAMAECMDALLQVSAADAHLGLRVTSGAMLCIAAVNADTLPPALLPAFLAALESRVRERLRPSDRVYCTDSEVVVWLTSTPADGALRAAQRLEPIVARVPVPSVQRLEVACRIGVAVADNDATSFTELLAVARGRSQRGGTVVAA